MKSFSKNSVQTYSVPEIFNGLTFQDSISTLKSINVPTYSIVVKSINPVTSEDTKDMVYRDRNNVLTISAEVGDEKVTFNAESLDKKYSLV